MISGKTESSKVLSDLNRELENIETLLLKETEKLRNIEQEIKNNDNYVIKIKLKANKLKQESELLNEDFSENAKEYNLLNDKISIKNCY